MNRCPTRIVPLVLLVLGAAGGGWWALQEEPPAPVDVAEVQDTGMTDAETEELMIIIGYTQQ